MSVVIIHRPTEAAKALVASVSANQASPKMAHLAEIANKSELTECEALWFEFECAQYLVEKVTA